MSELPELFLFNPENDAALASGQKVYTPGRQVDIFRKDASLLPVWYADNGYVLSSGHDTDRDKHWWDRVRGDFGLKSTVVDRWDGEASPRPWGWSANAVWLYEQKGVLSGCLPSKDAVACHRELSHRRTAAQLALHLRELLDYPLPETAVECFSVGDLLNYAEAHPAGFFMKSPWSSSGRGVMDSRMVTSHKLMDAAAGIVKRQGSVMLETRLDRVLDFAMLYRGDASGRITHCGYSVFSTNGQGNYIGNLVASDSILHEEIAAYINSNMVYETACAVEHALNDIVKGRYQGYLGVDMMVYRDHNAILRVYPSVEINFRMTMGVVAWRLARRIMAPEAKGIYSVAYAPSDTVENRYEVENGYLVKGTVDLLPPSSRFKIRLTLR